jgi:hypothetical protein
MMLVTVDDLEGYLEASFSASQITKAEGVIERVSGTVQRYCTRYALTETADDVVVLQGSYSYRLPLPKGPASSVSEVLVDGNATTDYDLVADVLIRTAVDATTPFHVARTPHWGGTDVEVQVTYTHGFAAVPDDVKDVVLLLAAERFDNPTGDKTESIDGYSHTRADPRDLLASLSDYRFVSRSAVLA